MIPEEVGRAFDVVERVVDEYHALVMEEGLLGAELRRAFGERLRESHMYFGDRVISPFARPHFLTRGQLVYVQSAIRDVLSAIAVVERRMNEDPAVVAQVCLSPGEAALIEADPGVFAYSTKSRMDTFLTPTAYKFCEYNAESPAGMGYGDVLQDLYLGLPTMQRLAEKYRFSPLKCRPRVLELLLQGWKQWGGSGRPRIGIIDYDHVPTHSEFLIFQEYFEKNGFEVVVADPRSLELRQGRLMAGNFAIDLVYRRVLVNELLEHLDECHALVEAVRTRAVCMLNSFRCKMLHKKLLFALLWSDEMQAHFTAAQVAAVRRHVPWTCRVEEGFINHKGRRVDLVEFAMAEQQRLVLKPNDEYGGKGVVIGWERTASQWEEALRDALAYPHILQERVPVPRADFPDLDLNMAPRIVDLDPYVFNGEAIGFLTRLSDTSLCNVTSGGRPGPHLHHRGVALEPSAPGTCGSSAGPWRGPDRPRGPAGRSPRSAPVRPWRGRPGPPSPGRAG